MKEKENIELKTVIVMKVHLKMICQMEKVLYTIKIIMLYMMVIGLMVNMKETEHIIMKKVAFIKGNGKMIQEMEREYYMIRKEK